MSLNASDIKHVREICLGVVIPVYNRAPLVCRALNSLMSQTRLPDYIIIVDNNSTDNLHDVLHAWLSDHADPGTQLDIIREDRPGAANARQTGFEYFLSVCDNKGISRKDAVITFLDSDDLWYEDYSRFIRDAFGADPSLQLLISRLALDSDQGVTHPHFDAANPLRCHLIHGMINTGSMAVRADLFDRIGGWNRHLRIWDDWELGVRLLLAKPDVRYVEESFYKVCFTPESLTGLEYSSRAGRYEVSIDAIERLLADDTTVRDSIRRLIPYRRAVLAAHYQREGYKNLARPLLRTALDDNLLDPVLRLWLRVLYRYTAAGGRGAYMLWR